MKKFLILTILFVLLGVSTVPALAARGGPSDQSLKSTTSGKQFYSLAGRIVSVNSSYSVAVRVATGNRLAKAHVGETVLIYVTANTRLLLAGGTPIAFSDLKAGQSVSSNGILVNNTWTASRITVGAILASK